MTRTELKRLSASFDAAILRAQGMRTAEGACAVMVGWAGKELNERTRGRPRSAYWEEVRVMTEQGLSAQKVAVRLGISAGAVAYARRKIFAAEPKKPWRRGSRSKPEG